MPTIGLKAQNTSSATVGDMWRLFSEKCQLFINDPNAFFQTPTMFTIEDWKWIMRAATSVGFVEYFSPSPDKTRAFTAIANVTSQGSSLECSLDGVLAGATNSREAFDEIKAYFSTRNDMTVSPAEVTFYGDPDEIAELKQYDSTNYLVRVEGGLADSDLVATVRTDDGGAIYFEVETLR